MQIAHGLALFQTARQKHSFKSLFMYAYICVLTCEGVRGWEGWATGGGRGGPQGLSPSKVLTCKGLEEGPLSITILREPDVHAAGMRTPLNTHTMSCLWDVCVCTHTQMCSSPKSDPRQNLHTHTYIVILQVHV